MARCEQVVAKTWSLLLVRFGMSGTSKTMVPYMSCDRPKINKLKNMHTTTGFSVLQPIGFRRSFIVGYFYSLPE